MEHTAKNGVQQGNKNGQSIAHIEMHSSTIIEIIIQFDGRS